MKARDMLEALGLRESKPKRKRDTTPEQEQYLIKKMKRIDTGRTALDEQGNVYPGGDTCPMTTARGLASLVGRVLDTTPAFSFSENEREALAWVQNWVNAAGIMPDHDLTKR